ncbi:MAG: bifunctional riboflavin kinase/FMN adenylyltransferase, partial [Parvibaculum sp.]|nr:bifunctional riboflavin kinase/FMN adenylyltransferase [Parvibaculum sp.]
AALPFDQAMSQKLAPEFVLDVLVNGLHAVHVVAGYDFRFGKGRGGDAAALSYMGGMEGYGVSIVEEVQSGGVTYSSTRIRELLANGDPRGAAALLGHWWTVETHIQQGDRRGRTIGFPTANLSLEEHVLPALGVYAVKVEIEDGPHKGVYDGVANVGRRPTFDKQDVLLEAHIFDFEGDIYGIHAAVSFIEYLRPERKFDGLDSLKAQIAKDSVRARDVLAALPRT